MARVKSGLGGLLAAIVACTGCTASIGGNGNDGGTGTGPGSGNPSGTGSGAASGQGGGAATGAGASGSGASAGTGPGAVPTNPGPVTLRRLNHAEYNNTVQALFETTLTPADDFPADDLGGDFDTVGSALSLAPAYVRAYESAAHALVNDLFAADAARRARIITCDVETGGDACAQSILEAFARKAWRRPVTAEEVATLMTPVTTARALGATALDGLHNALAAVLMSPFFVFKLEIDPDLAATTPRRLGGHELATRLSYALWSTTPDDVLSAAADAGELGTDEQITAQVDRMLADPRAEALLDTFAAQWLEYDDLETHEVESAAFPGYGPELARSMRLEARRFIQEFLMSPTAVGTMFNAGFTFVDNTLATHYGLPSPGAAGGEFARVDTTGAPRPGLLTLGAFLTATSLSSRTSPVKRGDFVFSRLLCQTVPPPPPDVPSLPEEGTEGLTLRQRLEQHRADPNCATCHSLMDPIGFGLENYDAIGAYRTSEGSLPIDATGTLPDGTPFDGALELSAALAGDGNFGRCLTKKFMTFAIGRLVLNQAEDNAWVDTLSARAAAGDNSLRSIVGSVILSEDFRSRRAPQSL
jgi:hypothetical protein